MSYSTPSDDVILELFQSSKTIAVVGCSPNPSRTSHQIARSMQAYGYKIIPVHPDGGTILGEPVYPDLKSIPSDIPLDIVNVFRRSEFTPEIATDAVEHGAKSLWMQMGVYNDEACAIAEKDGQLCIMDECIAVIYRALLR